MVDAPRDEGLGPESVAEYEAIIEEVENEADYWQQVAYALAVLLARHHLPFESVRKLVERVEVVAAAQFEPVRRYGGGVNVDTVFHLFAGLHALRKEQAAKEAEP